MSKTVVLKPGFMFGFSTLNMFNGIVVTLLYNLKTIQKNVILKVEVNSQMVTVQIIGASLALTRRHQL